MMLSMMISKKLSPKFWFDAVYTANHILNRSSTKALKVITPYKAYYGKKPNVSYFKVFGSQAYVHIEKKDCGKLDVKAIKTVFIGYAIESKGYKVYIQETRSIVLSCNTYISKNQIYDKKAEILDFIKEDDYAFLKGIWILTFSHIIWVMNLLKP
ncbi:hypothetical protein KP509_26G005100 [Ceratopteris richardii]|uniref:Retroviral polymerase SH3-like domain-containing protein n=1 Tax=Ceratopteris richardii TaxID=49495 RepID=A0A8T2RJZ1_CERRI|nr:hypothetical protein KP509_26G005100 [Ceratopteris richardii]